MDKKKLKALLMNKGFGVEGAEIAINAVWEYLQKSQAEAIKEFAERLKANRPHLNTGEQVFYIRPEAVDDLVKEMVGAENV
ncbi:MAG: hypothetical protein IJ339_00310 [Oscillospiraceae bacterium]|nr:hypothetical protein [Oscillospiraceae bacterium]